jgi:hypothetical protein
MIFREVTEDRSYIVDDDPVRPELSYAFRTGFNRQMFVIENEFTGDPSAAICVAYTDKIPKTVDDLDFVDFMDLARVAVFYTVWSYEKGAGRKIVFEAVKWIKENKPEIMRFVTLSPKTEMARRFHHSNGAITLSENEVTDNYEYRNV